ncbi:MAG: rhomboid family intramembrane serine protease [Bacteroidetes bacterium]|nr:rhomboid family intramembrane serine protease [Bacteroidota bacterium]MDA0874544.1 rhomboid family intramembrane serine protease [Bacteroidota bacterium]
MSSNRFLMWYGAQPRALRVLLAINVVMYLAWNLVLVYPESTRSFVLTHIALNPQWPGILMAPWQLLTYAFLHLGGGLGGLLHIGFNMLWMFWIGKDYEELYGPGRILGIYVYGAAGGALLTVALHALFPGVGPFGGTVHGASGAVLALMTMVAVHQPDKRVALMFIGVVRLIHVVIGFIALDILFLSAGGTSVSAHLGGVLTGFLMGRLSQEGHHPAPWAEWFFRSRYGRTSGSGPSSILAGMENWLANRKSSPSDTPTARVYRLDSTAAASSASAASSGSSASPDREEIDRILDKISATGYDSLTEQEKRRLVESSGDA